jgi:hypothetical protein
MDRWRFKHIEKIKEFTTRSSTNKLIANIFKLILGRSRREPINTRILNEGMLGRKSP